MALDFQNFVIDRVIIHQIFKRIQTTEMVYPIFNEECSNFLTEASDALQKRITKSFGNNSHSIRMSIREKGEGSVFSLISDYWNSSEEENDFINLSKKLTLKLAEAQNTRQYPGGVIVVLEGTLSEYHEKYIIFIKADIQDGFNIVEEDGKNLLHYVNNLLLTKEQKLQKMVIFVCGSAKGKKIESEETKVYLFDSNTNKSVSLSKADYFYNRFLGLEFCKESDYETNIFYNVSKDFFNSCDKLSPSERIDLQTQLKRYLRLDPGLFINPYTFINANTNRGEIIDLYIECMKRNDVPLNDIRKNLSMIDDSINKRKMVFSNSIKLEVSDDEIGNNIDIKEDGENTVITIKGKYINEK